MGLRLSRWAQTLLCQSGEKYPLQGSVLSNSMVYFAGNQLNYRPWSLRYSWRSSWQWPKRSHRGVMSCQRVDWSQRFASLRMVWLREQSQRSLLSSARLDTLSFVWRARETLLEQFWMMAECQTTVFYSLRHRHCGSPAADDFQPRLRSGSIAALKTHLWRRRLTGHSFLVKILT